MQSTISTNRKVDPINVKNIEELIYLLQEWDNDYRNNWWTDARVAYIEWLKFINNLKK
jgi:hypothetical protein